jgi:hypothetical protein
MTVRPRGRKRTLSKYVSSFNMGIYQVYKGRAIMEATGVVKDAAVIRELLDEALAHVGERRLGFTIRKNRLIEAQPKPFTRCKR